MNDTVTNCRRGRALAVGIISIVFCANYLNSTSYADPNLTLTLTPAHYFYITSSIADAFFPPGNAVVCCIRFQYSS